MSWPGICRRRSIVLHAAFHEWTVRPDRNADFPATITEGVAGRIDYELIDNHSQSPNGVRLYRKGSVAKTSLIFPLSRWDLPIEKQS
jgi:hypothetical protein